MTGLQLASPFLAVVVWLAAPASTGAESLSLDGRAVEAGFENGNESAGYRAAFGTFR